MAVTAFLLTVDGQIYIHALCLHPDFLDLLELNQVVRRAGTIDNIYGTVIRTVIQHVIDHGTEGRKADTACDKQKVLAF